MSKKLDTIIKKVPPATARDYEFAKKESNNEFEEKSERIVAVVPMSLKKQIRQYMVDHPGETEKTILLKALRSFGFSVDSQLLKDHRGRR